MILITGGCGYIGSHVVKALVATGEDVIVYDNLSQGSKEALLGSAKLVVGDITDSQSLKKVFTSYPIEAVFHLAALVNAAESTTKADLYKQVNDQGSKNVWESAKEAGVQIMLYASSAAVYGTPQGLEPIKETDPQSPTNVYGETKLAGEKSLIAVANDEVRYGIFRFFNVAGAEKEGRLGQSKSSRAIMQRLFAVAAGEDDYLTISGHDYDTKDGTVVRDFVHVEDIALAFVLGLTHLRQCKDSFILNLGSGETHTIGEVIKEVEVVTSKGIPVIYEPRIKGDISYSLADITQASKVLGWEPVHTLRLMIRDGWNSYVKTSI